jgi:tetratricopeptide (TPR) repeat protein
MARQSSPAVQAQIIARVNQLRADELPLLGRDVALAPDIAAAQYRYGLALYLAGKLDEAMERLERAVELEPQTPAFQQARDLLKEQMAK